MEKSKLTKHDYEHLIAQCRIVILDANKNVKKILDEKSKRSAVYEKSIERLNGRLTVMLEAMESEKDRFQNLAIKLKEIEDCYIEPLPILDNLSVISQPQIDKFLMEGHSAYAVKKAGRPVGKKDSVQRKEYEKRKPTEISNQEITPINIIDTVEVPVIEIVAEIKNPDIIVVKHEMSGEEVELTAEEIKQLMEDI